MYEQGWKKKLSLVVAASAEEVVDVTWRYSVDRQGVGKRRSAMFEERWLEATLKNLNYAMSIAVTPERKVSWSLEKSNLKIRFSSIVCCKLCIILKWVTSFRFHIGANTSSYTTYSKEHLAASILWVCSENVVIVFRFQFLHFFLRNQKYAEKSGKNKQPWKVKCCIRLDLAGLPLFLIE